MPEATLGRQEWTATFEYPQSLGQAQRASDFHDGALRDPSWQRLKMNRVGTGDDVEYEAECRRGNVRTEWKVDSDDAVEIELEIRTGNFGGELNLNSSPNLRLDYLEGQTICDQAWKLKSHYRNTSTVAVYTHYDRALTGQGGRRTKLDKDDGGYDVDYQVNRVKTSLEVEREGDGVSTEVAYESS